MKRFIDLRHHYEDIGGNFAWYCTISDRFESFMDSMNWETWEEFEIDCIEEGRDIERYRRLCPGWAFTVTIEAEKELPCKNRDYKLEIAKLELDIERINLMWLRR